MVVVVVGLPKSTTDIVGVKLRSKTHLAVIRLPYRFCT